MPATRRSTAEARKAGRAVDVREGLPNHYGKRGRKLDDVSTIADVSGWSEITDDLLVDIVGRLHTLRDFFAVRGVCKNWRKVASTSDPATLSSQSPVVVVMGRSFDSFYDFSSRRRYSLRLPSNFPNRRNIAYSHGHIVTKYIDSSTIHLWDIFTEATTILPPNPKFFRRVILSARPDSAHCQVVLRSMDTIQYLNVGNSSWNVVCSTQLMSVRDIVFFQGELLALNCDMELFAVELMGNSLRMQKLGGSGVVGISGYLKMWLGESDGVLLAVCKLRLKTFRIFRWNSDNKGWDEMRDLGDKALFADWNGEFASVSSTGLRIKKNCVYALDYWGGCDVYSVEYGSYYNVWDASFPSYIWAFPNHC